MNTVFVDTSVLVAAENISDAALYQATLGWLDVLWSTRSGRTGNRQQRKRPRQQHSHQPRRPFPPAALQRLQHRRCRRRQ